MAADPIDLTEKTFGPRVVPEPRDFGWFDRLMGMSDWTLLVIVCAPVAVVFGLQVLRAVGWVK